MMIPETLLWLSLNLYHEARNQPDHIQQAVGHVTINRAVKYNKTVKQVVKEPYQFSWTNDKQKLKQKPWLTDSETFRKCQLNAIRAMVKQDTTNKSTFYHEKRVKPVWRKELKRTKSLGPFHLYKKKQPQARIARK